MASTLPKLVLPTFMEPVTSWGGVHRTQSLVVTPQEVDEIAAILAAAEALGRSVGIRGAGCSYGDASCNDQQILIDLSSMNRILSWSPESGQITVEPGVTIEQLWQHTLPSGWWPTVVTGTQKTTVGGCVAMNAHGKNVQRRGPIGEHIVSLKVLTPDGTQRTITPDNNPEFFRAIVGGLGVLGVVTSVTLQMKRVSSGLVSVNSTTTCDLEETLSALEAGSRESEYAVGWIDCFARGSRLGRGQVDSAAHIVLDENTAGSRSLDVEAQRSPSTLLGVIPRSHAWRFAFPLEMPSCMRFMNAVKWNSGRLRSGTQQTRSLARFHFLLDSIPNWKRIYGRDGLIQYQILLPADASLAVFGDLLRLQHEHGLQSHLAVLKRHRPDEFLMSYGVDGFSLALDFPARRSTWNRLTTMIRQMDQMVLEAGGRYYLAKDQLVSTSTAEASFTQSAVHQFFELKQRLDPKVLLQTDLWRRLFADSFDKWKRDRANVVEDASADRSTIQNGASKP